MLLRGDMKWGVQVCKDMDFTPLSAEYGREGVGLMLVPGWDFTADWVFHGHMAIMRGVESGFSAVRTAKRGSLYVNDDRGRALAETRSAPGHFSTLLATVPAGHDATVYDRLGDWAAHLALLILLGALGVAEVAMEVAPAALTACHGALAPGAFSQRQCRFQVIA